MKTAIIISGGIKQIMFTPENEQEKEALWMFTTKDDVSLEIKSGWFHTKERIVWYTVDMCQWWYLRAWDSDESVMFVLTPKKTKK